MSQVDTITNELILSCFDQAMSQAFEAYFFTEIVRKPEGPLPIFKEDERLEVEVIFRGPFSGHLHLQVTRTTAAGLLSSIPLPSLESSDTVIIDLFSELTNTVGGRIAAALAGSDFAFDLTIPVVTFGPSQVHPNSIYRAYDTDFGSVLLSVSHLEERKIQLLKEA